MNCVQSFKSKWNHKKIVLFNMQIGVCRMEWNRLVKEKQRTIDLEFSDPPDLSMICHFFVCKSIHSHCHCWLSHSQLSLLKFILARVRALFIGDDNSTTRVANFRLSSQLPNSRHFNWPCTLYTFKCVCL